MLMGDHIMDGIVSFSLCDDDLAVLNGYGHG